MRTIGIYLAGHLAGDAHTLAMMLRLDLRDGTSIGVTDHDQDLVYDLGDGTLTYSASTGILPSDVVLQTGLESDNFEVTGPISSLVTRTAILGRRYTRARARLFFVNWADLDDHGAIMLGNVTDARIVGGRFVMEVRSVADAFNQSIGRTLSPYCSADFGDAKCGIVRTTYPCTITAVTGSMIFTVDLDGDHDDGFFTYGAVSFLTGGNAGTSEIEVFGYIGATGGVELFSPLAELPLVGDTLNLYRGCSRMLKSDDAGIPTCLSYDNVLNFRGFSEVPGSDLYLKASIPGAPGA